MATADNSKQTPEISFSYEYPIALYTGEPRVVKDVAEIPDITNLKKQFATVTLSSLEVDVYQTTFVGNSTSTLHCAGTVFVGLIPTGKNTNAETGQNTSTILNVPRKHAVPLSSTEQTVKTFKFNLTGYELDLAQDPRRQQGPVIWIANTGVGKYSSSDKAKVTPELTICHLIFKYSVACQGVSTLW